MRMNLKGQAALEFLMTYGWAILVVLVAIGALAYFGVLSPDNFLPSRCTLPSGIACVDYLAVDEFGAGNGYVTISIRNSLGYDITNVEFKASDCTGTTSMSLIRNGGLPTEFSATFCNIISGGKYRGDINLTYTNADTGLTHLARGSMNIRVT